MKKRRITPWTQAEVDEYVAMHEKGISQYPSEDVIIGGKIYNIQKELREDRIKWLASIPVEG